VVAQATGRKGHASGPSAGSDEPLRCRSFFPAGDECESVHGVLRLPRGVEIEGADAAAVPTAWLAAAVKALRVPVILLPGAVRVYFATAPMNLRRSFDGLSNEVRAVLGRDPLNGTYSSS